MASLTKILKTVLFGSRDACYDEGNINYWANIRRVAEFYHETFAGFKVLVRLTLHIRRVDNESFDAARMLEDSQVDKLVEDYVAFFKQAASKAGYLFAYDFSPDLLDRKFGGTRPLAPGCFNFKMQVGENPFDILFDPGGSQLVQAINSIGFCKFGCFVQLILIDKEFPSPELILENYRMISTEELKKIEASVAVRIHFEKAAIFALHSRLKMEEELKRLETSQVHKAYGFEVRTEAVGQCLKFTWTLANDFLGGSARLKIFRSESGFISGEAHRGTCIVDANRNGEVAQSLQQGREYFFSAILQTRDKEVDYVNFLIRIPTCQEVEQVERKLAALPKASEDPQRSHLNRISEQLIAFVEFEEALDDLEKELIKKIESKNYDSSVKVEKIDRIRSVVRDMKLELEPQIPRP